MRPVVKWERSTKRRGARFYACLSRQQERGVDAGQGCFQTECRPLQEGEVRQSDSKQSGGVDAVQNNQ